MPTAEEVRKLREERQIGMHEAATILRHREKLTRLISIQNAVHADPMHALHRLLTLLIEEERGE